MTKFLKSGLVLAAAGLFALACSQSAPTNSTTSNTAPSAAPSPAATVATPAPDELASTKKIYSEKCIKCHKEDGTGGQVDIEGTKIKVPDFTTDKLKKMADAKYIDYIENGVPDEGMPAFKGKISDEEIKNLVKLIRRDFQKQ